MKTVYCIGELLIDFVAERQGNDLSKAMVFTKKPGGAPANVACAISKLGGKSVFVGAVGKDPFGSYLLGILEEKGVDVSLTQRTDVFTTLAFVSLSGDGERDFVFARGADEKLKYDPTIGDRLKNTVVHFGAATALLGGDLEGAYKQYFRDAILQKAFICFDPNFRGDLWSGREDVFIKKCLPFIENAQICKFSLEEAKLLSGKSDLDTCCDYLHGIGTKIITITLGSGGTLISTAKTRRTIPSISVNSVDTTGAGDAFIGCPLVQLAEMQDPFAILNAPDRLIRMVGKANKAGAITTTGYGAIPCLPSFDQVFGP